jgi:hypothetical protein
MGKSFAFSKEMGNWEIGKRGKQEMIRIVEIWLFFT